ncbi:TonB-dependent receptor [bacterium]|nr:TonB-dependent receptor [bacterium]
MLAKRKNSAVGFFLILVIAFSPAIAQDMEDLMDLSLLELLNIEVSVATKSDVSLDDTPGIVTVIDRKTIELTSAKTLVDIIRMVPGFDYSRTSLGWGEPLDEFYARGTVNIFSQTILFLINGRNKLNDMVYASPWMSTRLNVDMIERVEIIRGPGSALYGGNAFSAVINIITRDTGTEPETVFDVAGGQYNFGSMYGLVKREIGDTGWKIGLQGKYFFEDGTSYDYVDKAIDDHITAGNYDSSFADYKKFVTDGVNPSFDVSMNITSPKNDLRMQVWYTNHTPHMFLSDARPQINGQTYHYQVTQLFYNLEFEPIKNMTIAAHRSRMTWDAKLNYGTPLNDLNNSATTLQLNYHNQVDVTYSLTPNNHNILLGGSYSNETMDDPQAIMYDKKNSDLINYEPYYSFGERNVISLFAQDYWKINDKFAATVGVRYDNFDDLEESNIINPRAALVWNVFGTSKVKLLYGQAFRPPAGFETGGSLGSSSGSVDLKPEKIRTGELAFIHYLNFARTQISGYYSQVTDPIDQIGGVMTNVGKRNALGIEMELESKNWWLNYTFTKSETEDATGTKATTAFLSPHMINAGFHFELFKNVTARNQLVFRSSRPAFDPNADDINSHLDDDLSIEFRQDKIRYIFGVKNLLDAQWECPLQYEYAESIKAYPYRGREFFAKVILKI